MIFIPKKLDANGNPILLFRGFVNGIIEREYNTGVIKTYIIGTSEKKQDNSKEYSSWFCGVIGNARKQEALLTKGTCIDVYGYKMTNVPKKNSDGTWGKAFWNTYLLDFEVHQYEPRNMDVGDENTPF